MPRKTADDDSAGFVSLEGDLTFGPVPKGFHTQMAFGDVHVTCGGGSNLSAEEKERAISDRLDQSAKIGSQAGIDLSPHALLDELSAIREVAVIYPQGTLAHRKDHIALSRMSPTQRKLGDGLEIATALKG